MNHSLSYRVSKFKILTTLCTLGVTTLSLPAMAIPKESCVKTPVGEVVCGEPMPKQSSQSATCSTIIRQGATLNWITLVKGSRYNQGIMTINVVESDGSWSAITNIIDPVTNTIKLTRRGPQGASGWINSSSFIWLDPVYHEAWIGSCDNQGRIEGQINGKPELGSDVTFVIW